MDDERKEIERYRNELHHIVDFLHNQSSNDLYILDLIKGNGLPAFEQALNKMMLETQTMRSIIYSLYKYCDIYFFMFL
jgi:hypothetical protein